MKFEFSLQIFEKHSNIKFHKIPSGGSQVPCGLTDGQTDMTQIIVAFNNFAKVPKIEARIYKKKQTKKAELSQGMKLVMTRLKRSLT
jgi:hypothetical protein